MDTSRASVRSCTCCTICSHSASLSSGMSNSIHYTLLGPLMCMKFYSLSSSLLAISTTTSSVFFYLWWSSLFRFSVVWRAAVLSVLEPILGPQPPNQFFSDLPAPSSKKSSTRIWRSALYARKSTRKAISWSHWIVTPDTTSTNSALRSGLNGIICVLFAECQWVCWDGPWVDLDH